MASVVLACESLHNKLSFIHSFKTSRHLLASVSSAAFDPLRVGSQALFIPDALKAFDPRGVKSL